MQSRSPEYFHYTESVPQNITDTLDTVGKLISEGWTPENTTGKILVVNPNIPKKITEPNDDLAAASTRKRITRLEITVTLGKNNGKMTLETENHPDLLDFFDEEVETGLTQAEIAFWLATQEPHIPFENENEIKQMILDKITDVAQHHSLTLIKIHKFNVSPS